MTGKIVVALVLVLSPCVSQADAGCFGNQVAVRSFGYAQPVAVSHGFGGGCFAQQQFGYAQPLAVHGGFAYGNAFAFQQQHPFVLRQRFVGNRFVQPVVVNRGFGFRGFGRPFLSFGIGF